ncbi:MAG: hypothetical protein AABZ78_12465 [Chloroflexota bacterium]
MTQTQIPTVQTGPAYVCPVCGKPIDFARWSNGAYMQPNWNNAVSREWEAYVYYMRHVDRGEEKTCKEALRFVRLGDCITPIVFTPEEETPNYNKRINEDVRRIRAALDVIAKAVRPEDQKNDVASKVVYGLLAGTMTPDAALEMLRDNVQHAKALLIIGEVKIAVPDDLASEVEARAKAQGETPEAAVITALRLWVTAHVDPDWLKEEMRARHEA